MKNAIIFLIISLTLSCSNSEINNGIIPYKRDSTVSDLNGVSNDSTTFFFPERLFKDTIRYIISVNDTFELRRGENIDTFINQRGLNRNLIRRIDSFQIKDVSFLARMTSFSLYKMNEPVLYNYNLNKEIYRLIVDRSFSKFFVFHIEKNSDSIFIVTKRLNRHVGYPFMVYAKSEVYYNPPGKKKHNKVENERFEARQDSMIRIYNNTNYFVDSTICRKISLIQWDTLASRVGKTHFWEFKPYTCGGCMQIDGSRWIIEGQNKYGYQIKEVLSPFSIYNDPQDYYDDLFKYILNLSGLDTTRYSFY